MSSELEASSEAQHVQEEMSEVVHELRAEHEKESHERSWLNQVALSTAIFAAFAAIAAMQGNSLANEAMLSQVKANDEWSLYQAQATKRHVEQASVILLTALERRVPAKTTDEIAKLIKEQAETQTKAKEFEKEAVTGFKKHEFYAYSVAALQIGISLGAMAALLRQRKIWYLSIVVAGIGIALMAYGAFAVTAG